MFGLIREDQESTFLDEMIGLLVAGLGFYTQFETQWRNGFSFQVPFPLSLITWPLDWAERTYNAVASYVIPKKSLTLFLLLR